MLEALLIGLLLINVVQTYIIFKIADKSELKQIEILEAVRGMYPLVTVKVDNVEEKINQSIDVLGDIKSYTFVRAEQQEKVIAELKKNQLTPQTSEVVNIMNEYLHGAKEE